MTKKGVAKMMTPNEIVEAMCTGKEVALLIPAQDKLEKGKIHGIHLSGDTVLVDFKSCWSNIPITHIFKADDPSISQYFKYKENMMEIIDLCHKSVKEYLGENE